MPLSPRQTNPGIPLHSEARGGGLRETVGEIPPEFRAALDLFVLKQPVPYNTEIPVLSDTILSTRVEQDLTSESMLIQVTKPEGIVTLEETYTDKFKQVGTRTKKFRPITDLPLISLPSSTREVQTNNLGNYHFVETIEDSGTLFTEASFVTERPDSAPEHFKELLPLFTESHIETGIASQPVLGDSEYRAEEAQRDVYTKKVGRTYRDPISFPATLGSFKMTPEQQIATGLDTLDDAPLNISEISAETVEASSEDLGDGTWTKRKFDVDEMFHKEKFSAERELLGTLPPEFRAGIGRISTSEEIEGIAELPILTGVTEFASEEQTTAFKKQVIQRDLDITGEAQLLGEELTELYGGGALGVVRQVNNVPLSVSGNYLVTEGQARALGGGLYFKETKTRDSGPWPLLDGQQYDERLDVVLPFTEQVLDATDVVIGTPKTDINPIDMWRSKARTVNTDTIAAVLDAYTFSYPSKINVELPDLLVSITGIIEESTGEGASSEDGTHTASGAFSVSQSLRASSQSSTNLATDVQIVIKQFWGNNINCTHYHFFLPQPVTSVDVLIKINELTDPDVVVAWPKFNPEIVNISAIGQRASLQVVATSGGSLASSTSGSSSTASGGTGYSRELGLNLQTVRISPTIHPEVIVGGTTTDTSTITAHADSTSDLSILFQLDQTQDVTASITPTTIPATVGATTWPTSGLFLYRVDAQPYRYGYVQFHAVVVDAADFPYN